MFEWKFMFEFWMSFVGISMAFGEVPQIVRIWRRKQSDDISLLMWIITLHGLVWWLVYGIYRESTSLIITNTVCVSLCVILIASIIKFRKRGCTLSMVFKVQRLEETVLLIRGYSNDTDDKYICVCTLYKPEGKKKWQVLGFLSKGGSVREAKETLQFLSSFPDGTYTYVSDEDFNRFYKKHNYKQIEL